MTQTEIWKPVPDWPPYEVSNLGRVRSYHTRRRTLGRTPTILKPTLHKNLRAYMWLQYQGRKKNFAVHRLVLLAFVGPCPNEMEACHNDGDCTNNRLENLRWDTRKANWQDARIHKTALIGESSPKAILTAEEVIAIRVLYSKRISIKSLAQFFHVSSGAVAKIVSGTAWKDAGGPISHPGVGDRSHNLELVPDINQ